MTRDDEIGVAGQSERFAFFSHPEISILLPTYNRSEALARTLTALHHQSSSPDLYEIVIVDDGSSDNTLEVINECVAENRNSINYLGLKENGGPARARNIGLSKCRGKVVLIMGDDIEPERDFVARHLAFHHDNPDDEYAMLGYVSFPPQMQTNSFMRWLETRGRRYFFNYQELQPDLEAGPLFFYTCNVSVKAALLAKSGWFDESFLFASHEDLELGYRLSEHGMRLVYEPSARGYHWHLLTVRGIARRVYLMGYSADLFWKKVKVRGGILKRAARCILARVSSTTPFLSAWERLCERKYADDREYPMQWHLLLFLSFFIGLADSGRGLEPRL